MINQDSRQKLNDRLVKLQSLNNKKMIEINFDNLINAINTFATNFILKSNDTNEENETDKNRLILINLIIDLADSLLTDAYGSHQSIKDDVKLLTVLTNLANTELCERKSKTDKQWEEYSDSYLRATANHANEYIAERKQRLKWLNLGLALGSVFSGTGAMAIIASIVLPVVLCPPALALTLGVCLLTASILLLIHSFSERSKTFQHIEIKETDKTKHTALIAKIGVFRETIQKEKLEKNKTATPELN